MFSAIENTTGTITRVSSIELVSPPISTQAIPFFHSEAAPEVNAIGNNPIIIEKVVIRTGRSLIRVAISRALMVR